MKKLKILTASGHPGGANSLVPVIKKLENDLGNSVLSIAHDSAGKILDKEGIFYITPSKRSLEDINNFTGKIIEPDFILTGTNSPSKEEAVTIEQATIYSGKIRSIPSIAISDVWNSCGRFDDLNNNIQRKFLPTKIAVADKYAKRNFLDEGFSEFEVILTGNPHFDNIIDIKKSFTLEERKKVRKELGFSTDSYLFSFFSQPIEFHYGRKLGYTEKDALRGFLSSLERLKDKKNIEVLVKVHPRESLSELKERTKDSPFPVKVDLDYDTKKAVMASDAICSMFSTVLIESSYFDKPSISFQPNLIGEDLLITNKLGVSVPIYTQEEMNRVSEMLLFNQDYVNELAKKRKDFKTDGKATERVTNLIYEIIK